LKSVVSVDTLIRMLAFHGILTAYGFWLPNDPRGSWSEWVASWELYRFGGKATKIGTRRSVAGTSHNVTFRIAAKQTLKYKAVKFSGLQARAIGRGFAIAARKSGHRLLACAILPQHVHVVVVASKYKPTQVIGHLKREASLVLLSEMLHPFQDSRDGKGKLPSCWAENSWRVYLDDEEGVVRAFRYVERNPMKEGKPAQRWSFIEPYIS
jgi:REP element-mobilizing transposase RayT